MGRLLNLLADDWNFESPLGQEMAAYQEDIGPAGHSLPLRIAGGLHALVLRGDAPILAAAYPPNTVPDDVLRAALLATLKTHQDFLLDWSRLPPQTNEVRRSAALIAMAHEALHYFDRPIVLSELGASAGLNLMWDHFALTVQGIQVGPDDAALSLSPEWEGPVPRAALPQIVERSGVDLSPLNPKESKDLWRLLSYLWPDQPHRAELTRSAASVLHANVAKGDAIDWLEHRLNTAPKDHMHLIQHTVAWQYFPASAQARGTALIEAAGARASHNTPIVWMQMETDGDRSGAIGAALTLRLWPGDLTLNLGRADFHGRWINWVGPTHSPVENILKGRG